MEHLRIINNTANRKIGKGISVTYRPVGITCPQSCGFLNNGCYAQKGFVQFTAKKSVNHNDILNTISNDVVRHHVSGDFFKDDVLDVKYLNNVLRYHADTEKIGWTYSHKIEAFINAGIKRSDIPNNFKCLASVESVEEANKAKEYGYSYARVSKKWDRRSNEVKCLYQTTNGRISCDDCKLCFTTDHDILFKKH